jgi:hypothetical protein
MRFLDKHVGGGGKRWAVVGCEEKKREKRKKKEREKRLGKLGKKGSGVATSQAMIDLTICSICDLG